MQKTKTPEQHYVIQEQFKTYTIFLITHFVLLLIFEATMNQKSLL